MMAAPGRLLRADAPIETWFGVGGRADVLAAPTTMDELCELLDACADMGPIRVHGDGANLLVEDAGVDGLVLSLAHFNRVSRVDLATLRVGAGANLPRLIVESVRDGLGGLETLGGIPATLGGAVRMNAGGAFGEIASVVRAVRGVAETGEPFDLPREAIPFGYRSSGLEGRIITEVDLELTPADAGALRERLKKVMAHKKRTQPMRERSAGCVFKNPIVNGERQSAGKLIDEAGGKGERVGGVQVSEVHANFFVTSPGASARDVCELMDLVGRRVFNHAGVKLEPELVIWRRAHA